ncbi:MAG: 1-(5-phosphoribosyl)-5-[(5-phosphoribosylamino)methylideneamino]imidazole-4-carboxamide isomerase [Candidatus Aureabacteria bacterium]|nr:1-(5-phosphoribosyl)-5-[(5-phosphoribosylamino)methylideneamino]imidazole-4-carboxamide isomerase [Candidatus Auribacterota bacterium]
MVVIPAIDIYQGKVVRLKQGSFNNIKIYGNNPLEYALEWERQGAKRIHIVDLEGAKTGSLKNLDVITSICKALKIPVEVGGGIRDISAIDTLLNSGVQWVIIGTQACASSDFLKQVCSEFGERIIVSIDAKDDKVAVQGWQESSEFTVKDIIEKVENIGVKTVVYTDISRDGMLTGPNLEKLKNLVSRKTVKVIASGGISCLDDIEKLVSIKDLMGVIVGKALYEKRFDLREAIKLASGE